MMVLVVPSIANCQSTVGGTRNDIDRRSPYFGFATDKEEHLFGAAGLSWVMEGIHTERSYRLGVEYANNQGHQIFGVTCGAQVNAVFLCFRGSVALYFDGTHLDPRIFPEAGVNFIVFQATYGWCVPKLSNSIDEIGIGRGTLSVDLYRLLPKKDKKPYRPKRPNNQ